MLNGALGPVKHLRTHLTALYSTFHYLLAHFEAFWGGGVIFPSDSHRFFSQRFCVFVDEDGCSTPALVVLDESSRVAKIFNGGPAVKLSDC